ncbi:Sterol-binding domain protein [Desulfatibacillum aliphaticivorans]|uniref:Sterol-binding domain protein n=1 Tax=Desulfatibacillum aliphaticivorans TaxID=218208 RepID=B8FAF1_DESAL|nr:SCP2 sterol-binding domain-containing protein [Desulfatibacillum aliphaticivorans]ACL03247.1 Sterol-binding domain protein [Desulfatibacillum aliphaticivorans]
MTESMCITLRLDVKELMTEFLPKVAREFMRHAGTGAQFQGAALSLVVEISGKPYFYVFKDGEELSAGEGDLDSPTARVCIDLKDMERLIRMKNIDLFVGLPADSAARAGKKQSAVKEVKGLLGLELTNDDDSVSKVSVILNNAREPNAVFKLTMKDARKLMSGKQNPVSMFMSGQLRIDGDIGFAMALQPLFT